jgi:hypothetical protein
VLSVETDFGKNIFLQIFLKFQIFSVKCVDGLILTSKTRAVLPDANLAIAHPVRISIGLRLASLSLPYTHLCIFMASCVFFSWISPEILAFCAHLFVSHDLHCVFHYSFKSLCI